MEGEFTTFPNITFGWLFIQKPSYWDIRIFQCHTAFLMYMLRRVYLTQFVSSEFADRSLDLTVRQFRRYKINPEFGHCPSDFHHCCTSQLHISQNDSYTSTSITHHFSHSFVKYTTQVFVCTRMHVCVRTCHSSTVEQWLWKHSNKRYW